MPLYEYECGECGVFTALRKMSESAEPVMCSCGCLGERIISAPHLAVMDRAQRSAHERNEKSAHEPQIRRRSSCGCTGSHTCKTTPAAARAKEEGKPPPLQMQTKKTARPWMLGH